MAVLRPDVDEGGGGSREACWSPVVFCCRGLLLKTTREEREEQKRQEKKKGRRGGVGSYCSGAQTWRSDCSQRLWSVQKRGGGRGVQCKRSRVSSLPDVVIGPDVHKASWYTHIRRQMYLLEGKHSWEFTWQKPSPPPPPHGGTQKQQDVAVGKLLSVSMSSVRTRCEKISHL